MGREMRDRAGRRQRRLALWPTSRDAAEKDIVCMGEGAERELWTIGNFGALLLLGEPFREVGYEGSSCDVRFQASSRPISPHEIASAVRDSQLRWELPGTHHVTRSLSDSWT